MSKKKEMSETTRRSVLAALMMVLLAGSVGAAWWVSASRHFDPQAGVDMLAGIREKGLSAFWSDKRVQDWYLLRTPDGRLVGWRAVWRTPAQGEYDYAGGTIEQVGTSATPQMVTLERSWKLDGSGSAGAYQNVQRFYSTITMGGREIRVSRLLPKTTYEYADDAVHVTRTNGQRVVNAESDTRGDFIPAGMFSLVMYRTALEGKKAIYTRLIPENTIEDNNVAFYLLHVSPEGGRVVRAAFYRLEVTPEGTRQAASPEIEKTYAFDESGRLVKETDLRTNVSAEISTAAAVVKAFPEAGRYHRSLVARETPATLPATLPVTQPTTEPASDSPATEPAPDTNEPEGF